MHVRYREKNQQLQRIIRGQTVRRASRECSLACQLFSNAQSFTCISAKKKPTKLPARPFEKVSIFFTCISQTGITNRLSVEATYANLSITILLQLIWKNIVAMCWAGHLPLPCAARHLCWEKTTGKSLKSRGTVAVCHSCNGYWEGDLKKKIRSCRINEGEHPMED